MGKNSVEQHIRMMYPNWLQQSERLCAHLGRQQEAQDILQEVICDILQRYDSKIQEWCEKQESNYKALDCIVMYILKKNIYSHTAKYYQRYYKNLPAIDRNRELSEIYIIACENDNNLLEIVEETLDRLEIPQNQKNIFSHYYFEHKRLIEWPGPESLSKLSRICHHITGRLKEEIKKYQ